MVQEDRDQLVDLCSRVLFPKVKELITLEWLPENERGFIVGIQQRLVGMDEKEREGGREGGREEGGGRREEGGREGLLC